MEKLLGNRYEILEEIGCGGMAKVYKAKCRLLNRFVAVKVLRDDLKNDSEFVRRFNIESQAAASLSHTNIVPIYDVGEENGVHYIVMEYIIGITLKEYIEQQGAIEWYEAVNFAAQIARALEVAHKNFIVHRDIKPHNIIVTDDKILKVTDFGIARANNEATMTMDGNTIGSVQYISPEQARGGYTDEKTDIYSLGVVLYEMTTGRVPFGGTDNSETAVAIALKHIQDTPIAPRELNLAIPKAVEAIIQKAMAKEQSNRYSSASQILSDLERVMRNPEVRISGANPTDSSIDNSRTMKLDPISETERVPLRKQQSQNTTEIPTQQLQKSKKSTQEKLDEFLGVDKVLNPEKRGKIKLQVADKKRAMLAISVVATLIIGLVVFGMWAMGIINCGGVLDVVVPNFVGLNISELTEVLDNNGEPQSQRMFTIPQTGLNVGDLEILARDTARFIIQIDGNGLPATAPAVINALGDDAEPGTIFRHLSPNTAGRTVRYRGEPIRIVVSIVSFEEEDDPNEEDEIVLRNFFGRDLEETRAELRELGILVEVDREHHDMVPINAIISQNPIAGTIMEEGDVVTFLVSRGPADEPDDPPDLPEPPPARQYEGWIEISLPRDSEPTLVTLRLASTGQILNERNLQPGEVVPIRIQSSIPNPTIEVLHNGVIVRSKVVPSFPIN